MKRCKRCYSVIEKGNTHCPNCGLEANLKNVYYTKESKKIYKYNTNSYNQKNVKNKFIVIFFILFYVIMFFIGVIISMVEEKDGNISYEFDTTSIEDYLYNTKLIAEDYYKVWTLALTNKVTLNMIVDNTSLTYHNLNNKYCKDLSINPTINNSLKCVKNAYIDNGTYQVAFNDLESFRSILDEYEFKTSEYEKLYNIYLSGVNLYNSINEEKSYDKFEEKYNLAIIEIEYLIHDLNNDAL